MSAARRIDVMQIEQAVGRARIEVIDHRIAVITSYSIHYTKLYDGAFAYAFYRLYLRPAPCAPGDACAVPTTRRNQRIAFWVTLVGAKALIASPYVYAALAN